jgi:hypothetical protein
MSSEAFGDSFAVWPKAKMILCGEGNVIVMHGPLKLRTKHGGDNSRSL